MTDQNEPEPGMPTAGRKPPPSEDEPTVERPSSPPSPPPSMDSKTVELDGPTRPLSVPRELPPAPSPDPATPERTAQPDPGEATRVLQPRTPAKTEDQPEPVREKEAAGFLRKRPSSAGALILVLLALFGFTLVVQLRSNDSDEGLASARQEDLVRILSDLEARDSRLQSEISALETSQRQLTSGVAGRQAALAEAQKRSDELGLLAGTLAGRGPGLRIVIDGVKASAILNTVQELRGAGGEVMQIAGAGGRPVRIVASSYFVDAEGGGIMADGQGLSGPYVLTVIGQPSVMQTALQIPGGVVASVNSDGGSVTLEQRTLVEVTAIRDAKSMQYARPAS
ncbi:DUF881 domain-containing protein [Paractinoplanes lichenicola]|uniref:DUF881 domain-containing protein n=1 Tax=Paractinoplanes lichenicola TaxID=2802976 RepID=A0ABS1VTV5_9ACTN|nr:DUF881 domain-containing protein [Actinoplanes lichenicola]MBL7257906.1 DUF881 domain-containing protein [Actinoplanes lichenicola]